jgi:O-succinylbenzoic acid--CoA ligase
MIKGWLKRAAAEHGWRRALIAGEKSLSYAELYAKAEAGARGLIPGETIGISLPEGDATLIALASAILAGCPFLPLDPLAPKAKTKALMSKAGVGWIVADSSPCPLLIIGTSGSTGEPKGVMLSEANIAAAVIGSRQRLGLAPGDVWLGCLPLFHIGGLSIFFRCLEAGATMLLHDEFNPEQILSDIAEKQVTHLSLVPAMLAKLVELGQAPAASLRILLVGGAALSPELAKRARALGWPIIPTYGMTETASQAATLYPMPEDWQAGEVGQPLPGLEIGLDEQGRVKLRGPSLMLGYVNPEHRPGDGLDGEGWFITNDLGHIAKDGSLTVLGRADDMLISGGKNIHPLEIEPHLAACPGVSELALTGRPDPVWGDLLVAVYAGAARPEEVLHWGRERLEGPYRPREAVRVSALPRNRIGKLDREKLREMASR